MPTYLFTRADGLLQPVCGRTCPFVKKFPYISFSEPLSLVSVLGVGDMTYRSDFVHEIDLEADKQRQLEVLLGYKCQILFIISAAFGFPKRKYMRQGLKTENSYVWKAMDEQGPFAQLVDADIAVILPTTAFKHNVR